PGGIENHEPGRVDARAAFRNPGLDDLLARQRPLAVDAAADGAPAQKVERALTDADPAHAVMDAAWPQPLLRDQEARTLLAQTVALGHPAALVADLGVARVALAGVPHDRNVAHAHEARGVSGHDDLARAQMRWRLGIGHRHHDRKGGSVGGAGEPFVPV